MRRRDSLYRVAGIAAAAGLALGLASCLTGCDAVSTAATAHTEAPRTSGSVAGGSLAGLLPSDVRSAGKLVVATDPTYPPFESLSADQKTIEGLDPELLGAIADRLGVKVQFARAGFDSIIPGLAAGRYDMAMSAMTDDKAREKQVSFVDYFTVGGAVLMSATDPARGAAMPDALCGKDVGVQTGTILVSMNDQDSQRCQATGKPGIRTQTFPSVPASSLALTSGRIQYVRTDTVSASALVDHSSGKLVMVDDGTPAEPTGMVFPKDRTQLVAAVKAGLQAIIDDGTYARILAEHGLSTGAVKSAVVDGAVS